MAKAHDSIDKCIAQHEGSNKKFQRGGQVNPLSVPPVPKPAVPPIGGNNPGGDNQTTGYNPHLREPAPGDVLQASEVYYEHGGKTDTVKKNIEVERGSKEDKLKTIKVGDKTHTWNPTKKKTAHVESKYQSVKKNGKKKATKSTTIHIDGEKHEYDKVDYEDGGKTENKGLTDKQRKKREHIVSNTSGKDRWKLKHQYPDLFGYQQSDEQIKERKYQKKLWRDTKKHRDKVGWGKKGKPGSKTKVAPYIKDTDREKDKK